MRCATSESVRPETASRSLPGTPTKASGYSRTSFLRRRRGRHLDSSDLVRLPKDTPRSYDVRTVDQLNHQSENRINNSFTAKRPGEQLAARPPFHCETKEECYAGVALLHRSRSDGRTSERDLRCTDDRRHFRPRDRYLGDAASPRRDRSDEPEP